MKIKLTAANVRTLMPDPRLKDGDTFWDTDVRSFGLRVRVSGDRGYVVRYEHGGKQKTVTLPFNLYTFKEAKKTAKGTLASARLGADPAGARDKARQKVATTFGSMLKAYLEVEANKIKAEKVKPRTYEGIERSLMAHTKPLHSMSLARPMLEIKQDIAARLVELAAGTGPGPAAANATAKNVSGYCSWLVEMGILEVNPCSNIVKAVENGSRDHVIGFPGWKEGFDGELGAIWNATIAVGGEQSIIAQLLIILLMRRCEVGDLEWREVNRDYTLLTLPWHRTKQKSAAKKKFDFVVPLPPLATELLRAIPRRPGRDLVFGRGDNGRGFQGWHKFKASLDALIQPPIRPWRLHDIRRCGSTAMAEYDLAAPHIREAILGHTVGGIAGIYCKAEFVVPRRQALERWCAFVLDAAAGKQPALAPNVMTFPRAS